MQVIAGSELRLQTSCAINFDGIFAGCENGRLKSERHQSSDPDHPFKFTADATSTGTVSSYLCAPTRHEGIIPQLR